jgi:hypothetical protein
MQTFVPFADSAASARVLDNKRLNKQLLEGRQIYNILASGKRTGAWVNHPAVKMWRNYDTGLFVYLSAIMEECQKRGIKWENNWNAIYDMHINNWHRGDNIVMPPWWGDSRVHVSHRQNLHDKDPEHYHQFIDASWLEKIRCCDRCNYFWPTHTLYYNAELVGV